MVTPALRAEDAGMPLGPWVDPENFNPGYMMRSMHLTPTQGDREPRRLLHDHPVERNVLPAADLDDGTLQFK
jgi:monooxygenase